MRGQIGKHNRPVIRRHLKASVARYTRRQAKLQIRAGIEPAARRTFDGWGD